jgi:hypothetical protein
VPARVFADPGRYIAACDTRENIMELFNFANKVGKHLFGKEGEAGEKIKEEIEQDIPTGIRDLNVGFENGVVSLIRHADSPEPMEKAVLMAGNVKGVAPVKAHPLETPAQTAKVELYVIEKGDTLSATAHQVGARGMRIFWPGRIRSAPLITSRFASKRRG